MADHNWKVGQTVYVVMHERYMTSREAKIVTVGREWATLDFGWPKYRFNVRDAWIDGGKHTNPGRVFESKEAHEAEVARANAWNELWNLMQRQYRAPSTATIGAIETARELLFGARVKEASNG